MPYVFTKLFTAAICFIPAFLLVTVSTPAFAQKSGRSTTQQSQANETETKRIRVRARESLNSVAARAGVDVEELAKVNNLPLKTKLKKGQLLLLPPDTASEGPNSGSPNGMLIKFADGGTLHVDNAWWQGQEVWYTQRGVTETSSRKVKSIEPIFVAKVASRNIETPPPISPKSSEPAASTWIYLVGGARFKVDEVNKTNDGAWYQRGNILSFLESARIERIEVEQPGNRPSDWQNQGWSSGSAGIDQLIRSNGARFGVDPYLVFLVIEQESHFHTRALSPKGAQGLMQLMPGTARRFGVRRPYDPGENIRGGTQYLKELLGMFKGRVDLALASYNAGEHRVISFGNKVPPFTETQNYVRRINQRYKKGTAKTGGGKTQTSSGIHPALPENNP